MIPSGSDFVEERWTDVWWILPELEHELGLRLLIAVWTCLCSTGALMCCWSQSLGKWKCGLQLLNSFCHCGHKQNILSGLPWNENLSLFCLVFLFVDTIRKPCVSTPTAYCSYLPVTLQWDGMFRRARLGVCLVWEGTKRLWISQKKW